MKLLGMNKTENFNFYENLLSIIRFIDHSGHISVGHECLRQIQKRYHLKVKL